MSGNSTKDYNDFIRENLPTGMIYNGDVDRYQVNDHSFFTYKKSDWYYGYISKFGYLPIPAILFANGEQGAWYDPSDLSTLFQDSAGITPVTTAGQPVGLTLDKSQGLVLGPELVTDGGFSNGSTDWDVVTNNGWDFSGGSASHTGSTAGRIRQLITTEVGKTYAVVFDLNTIGDFSISNTSIAVRNSADSVTTAIIGSSSFTPNADLSYSLYFVATGTSHYVAMYTVDNVALDNISTKLLSGNHATQATSAARPTYQYVWDGVGPLGTELVTNGDFSNGTTGWEAQNANVSLASVGGQLEVTNNGAGWAYQSITTVVGKVYILDFDYITRAGAGQFRAGTSVASTAYALSTTTGAQTVNFVAATTTTFISLSDNAGGSGVVNTIDNVSVKEIPVGSRLHYLASDGVDDSLNWTATADDYTIARVNLSGTVTIQTTQALSGAADIFAAEDDIAGYVAVNRALTTAETSGLTAYLEGLAT
jgi:hypothetical protein